MFSVSFELILIQDCRGYGDSHGDSHGYGCGMGMGTMMNPHGSVKIPWGFSNGSNLFIYLRKCVIQHLYPNNLSKKSGARECTSAVSDNTAVVSQRNW